MRFSDEPSVGHTKSQIRHYEKEISNLQGETEEGNLIAIDRAKELKTDIWIAHFYLKVAKILFTN